MPNENPRKRGMGGYRGRGGPNKRAKNGNSSYHQQSRPKFVPREETDTVRLTEKDIGITEYISNHQGFNGVIKQRFSDFLVNEIKPDGTEVHLTNTAPPEALEPIMEETTDILPQSTWDEMTALLETQTGAVEVVVTEKSKEERTSIHNKIKKVYGRSLMSNTEEKEGVKYIIVRPFTKDAPKRREAWSDKFAEYVHFALYKENVDTMEAVNLLARNLKLKPGLLTYAGTKDRRAKTCQMVCIKRVDPVKITAAANSLRSRGIHVGDYEKCKTALRLGQLAGNRFQIVLRNVTGNDEQIDASMSSLKQHGFLNYFGWQRFGTQSVPTHHIGRALLQGNWQEAVELILKPRGSGECSNLQEVREVWWSSRDATKAFKLLQGKTRFLEGQLLLGLMKSHENDLVSALEFIPRNTRLMYMHAYQSYIWNQVLSRRVQELGMLPVAGDLVLANSSVALPVDLDDITEQIEPDTAAPAAEADKPVEVSKLPKVRVLTAAEATQCTLHDVLLPLPGHEVTYPGHAAAQWYEELMAKDKLSSAALNQNIRKYTLGGTYRKISVLPTKVSWRVVNYSDPTQSLLLSDLEIMKEFPPIQTDTNGIYRALVLDFCLPSSVYATMALREVLKCDTSARHQSTLNSYSTSVATAVPDSVKTETKLETDPAPSSLVSESTVATSVDSKDKASSDNKEATKNEEASSEPADMVTSN